VIASDGRYFVELHDFNRNSGVVHNQALIASYTTTGRAHSACFSADGSKLYVCGGPDGDDLIQYNLDSLPVISMRQLTDASHYMGSGIRRGPDGRIYSIEWNGIYTVMSPNLAGAAADLRYDYLTLPAGAVTSPHFIGTDVVGQPELSFSSSSIDTLICDVTTTIKAPAGYQSYLWSDGDTAASKLLFQNGLFWLQSLSGCGVRRDSFMLTFSHCNCLVTVPTAFSPNNDGRNDVFHVMGDEIEAIELHISNRWGQAVFHSVNNSNTVDWDGKFKGGDCDQGVYYYWLRVRCVKGQVVFRKGDLTLVR
jgi:gliding motility-associated-like protein